jgi:hypothetical protein
MVVPRLALLLALVAAFLGCDRGRPLPNRSPAPSYSVVEGVAASIHVALGVPVDADPSDDFIITRPAEKLVWCIHQAIEVSSEGGSGTPPSIWVAWFLRVEG